MEREGWDTHSMGSHWIPFGGADYWIKRIPEMLERPLILGGFSNDGRQPWSRKVPPEWPVGYLNAWPLRIRGAATVHRIDKAARRLRSSACNPSLPRVLSIRSR
jgi:hypothetical protein